MKPIPYTQEAVDELISRSLSVRKNVFMNDVTSHTWVSVFLSTPSGRRFETKTFKGMRVFIQKDPSTFDYKRIIQFTEEKGDRDALFTTSTTLTFREDDVLHFLLHRTGDWYGDATIILRPGVRPIRTGPPPECVRLPYY